MGEYDEQLVFEMGYNVGLKNGIKGSILKDNVYKAIQEMMKYEHEGFINISLVRLDEILKKCGMSEDGN